MRTLFAVFALLLPLSASAGVPVPTTWGICSASPRAAVIVARRKGVPLAAFLRRSADLCDANVGDVVLAVANTVAFNQPVVGDLTVNDGTDDLGNEEVCADTDDDGVCVIADSATVGAN